jgi:PAS domain-containing protein
MPDQQASEAVIVIDAAGRYTDANAAGLELLGVTRAELLASPSTRFSLGPAVEADQAALRSEWIASGTQPLVGTAGLRRADGVAIRVAYAMEASGTGFRARLWPADGSPEAAPSVFTVGDVLREWRSAERVLAELVPGTPEWARTVAEIEMLRSRYQQLFKAAERQSDDGATGARD